MSARLSTIKLLREWGRWGEYRSLGYPSRTAFFGERTLKAPIFGAGFIPPEIEAVERAVCASPWDCRRILILHYQRGLNFTQLGAYFEIRWRAARKRLIVAEGEVDARLNMGVFSRCTTAHESAKIRQPAECVDEAREMRAFAC